MFNRHRNSCSACGDGGVHTVRPGAYRAPRVRNAIALAVLITVGFDSAHASPTNAVSGIGLQGDPSALHFAPLLTLVDGDSTSKPGLKIRLLNDAPILFGGVDTASSVGLSFRQTTRSFTQWSASSERFTAGLSFGRASDARDDLLRAPIRTIGRTGLDTTSLGFTGVYRFATNWDVTGAYSGMLAESTRDSTDGLQRQPQFRERTLSLGVVKSETWRRGDRLTLSLGQPTRWQADARDGLDRYDSIDFAPADLATLRPGTREWLTELNYFAPIGTYTGLGLSLANRTRVSSDTNVPDERIMSIRFSTRF